MTFGEALAHAASELEAAGVDTPSVDAEWLLAHVAGLARSELAVRRGQELGSDEEATFLAGLERRARREPLAYVLGEWGFRRLTLAIDSRALVPRPETEIVVERCLELLAGLEEPRVVDIGVGSGAIALSIADEHPGARVVALDSSEPALALAEENRVRAGVDGRVRLLHGDLLTGIQGPVDLVVSNPPYVTEDEWESLQPEIRLYEPRAALVGEGVAEAIARDARSVLAPGGRLVLEAADGQASGLAGALDELGYDEVAITCDLAGRERVVEGRRW
jgi:release factor glutamine methyltransferase